MTFNSKDHLFFFFQAVRQMVTDHPQLRYGQAAMNQLYKDRPELYNKVHGTDADPFYTAKDDPKTGACGPSWYKFIKFLDENFYANTSDIMKTFKDEDEAMDSVLNMIAQNQAKYILNSTDDDGQIVIQTCLYRWADGSIRNVPDTTMKDDRVL